MSHVERLQSGSAKDHYAYSLFFSADDAARNEVQARFLDFLGQMEQIVRPAKSERVYQMHFDILDWGA